MKNDHPHLDALRKRHKDLEGKIFEIEKSPMPDPIEVAKLKKEKLRVKDEMTSLA